MELWNFTIEASSGAEHMGLVRRPQRQDTLLSGRDGQTSLMGKQATPNLGKHPTQGGSRLQLAPGLGAAEVGKGVIIVFVDADMTRWTFCGLSANLQEAVAVLGSGNCIAQFSLFSADLGCLASRI